MNAYLAEFFGTMLLILLGDGVVAATLLKDTKSENAGWHTIVIAWGLAVTICIYAVGRISDAHLNPAITIALSWSGKFAVEKLPGYLIAQFAGAFCGAVLVWIHYLPHWKNTDSEIKKLSVFCTSPAIRSIPNNLFSEILGTLVLVLAILFIGANDFTEGLKPVVVGALISMIGFSLGGTTGFAINPARDLGPRIAHFILPIPGKGTSDWNYAWVPVVGPVIGGLLGAFIFTLLFN